MESSSPNWPVIEAEYRTGLYSLRQLAKRHEPLSHTAIALRAKAEGWAQDLAAKVKVKREQKLAKEAAREAAVVPTAAALVEVVADKQVAVINGHKITALNGRELVNKLMDELGYNSAHLDDLRNMIDLIADSDEPFDKPRLRQLFTQAMTLPARAGALQKLVSAFGSIVDIERKAYGIEETPRVEKSYEERLRELMNGGGA